MIISHKNKFIFVKTNKTAGTSVEIFLSSLCGDKDVITPISPGDELVRQGLGYRGPQNFRGERGEAYNHMSLVKCYELFGDGVSSYYKFCIERNPADRLISHYFWENRTGKYAGIDEYFESRRWQLLKQHGWSLYAKDGELIVDEVIRYESLHRDMAGVLQRLGLNAELQLPNAKASIRTDRRHYTELLSEEQLGVIRSEFSNEINLFGYDI